MNPAQSLNAVKCALSNAEARDTGSRERGEGERPFVCATVGLRINDLKAVVALAESAAHLRQTAEALGIRFAPWHPTDPHRSDNVHAQQIKAELAAESALVEALQAELAAEKAAHLATMKKLESLAAAIDDAYGEAVQSVDEAEFTPGEFDWVDHKRILGRLVDVASLPAGLGVVR